MRVHEIFPLLYASARRPEAAFPDPGSGGYSQLHGEGINFCAEIAWRPYQSRHAEARVQLVLLSQMAPTIHPWLFMSRARPWIPTWPTGNIWMPWSIGHLTGEQFSRECAGRSHDVAGVVHRGGPRNSATSAGVQYRLVSLPCRRNRERSSRRRQESVPRARRARSDLARPRDRSRMSACRPP